MAMTKGKIERGRFLCGQLVEYATDDDDGGVRETLRAAKAEGLLSFVREGIDEARRQIEDFTGEYGW